MFITELFENKIKHAAFAFGRMNPPTVGHAKLIETVAMASKGGDYFIFPSQSQDSKKNPLDFETKVKFLRAMFPNHARHIVADPDVKTIMDVIHWLYTMGYRSITMIAGSDRLDSFSELIPKYNGVEGTNGSYYKFDNIQFVSSGDRDPDAEGISGVSASAARAAAKDDNFTAFQQATGAGKLSEPLFQAVRQGMNLTEEAAGVGVVAKNRKMAKDPRYSMSITKDVKPNTPHKMAHAFRLVQ